MSSVRFTFPKLSLQEMIHAPGGITVADALQQANANLETLKPQSRARVMSRAGVCEVVTMTGTWQLGSRPSRRSQATKS